MSILGVFRFDPDAKYVKKWIPELKDVKSKDLYDWPRNFQKYNISGYPKPIISNLDETKNLGISLFK